MSKSAYLVLDLPLAGEMAEVAVALLSHAGFEAFEEQADKLLAYVPEATFSTENVHPILTQLGLSPSDIQSQSVPAQNWNTSWEENYPPVEIDDYCQIIASFRTPKTGFIHTLLIDPKMSFGTGHHETTRLVVQQMRHIDFQGKTILDMGCGTGILGILASRLGAKHVLGIDIDPWSYENVAENCRLNHVNNMETRLGDVSMIPDVKYDVILANINRNVLLQDVAMYSKHLKTGGLLISSGYYRQDGELIEKTFSQANLQPAKTFEENAWLSQLYVKQ